MIGDGRLEFIGQWIHGWGPAKLGLHIGSIGDNGEIGIAMPMTFNYNRGSALPPGGHALQMSDADAVRLMDALWLIGIRPSKATVEPETTTAMKDHLADLRRLIFERRVK